MRVLLFTHKQDIDGMGCAVLAKVAFSNLEIIPCKTFEITEKVLKNINNGHINDFDLVFVTDLCIKEPVLSLIDKDSILSKKIKVIDHHKSEIDEGNDKYDFVSIILEDSGIKQSGTSLFYKYLKNNNYLESTKYLDDLVEWTRQYDVWEFKKFNNDKAKYLHILFEELGYIKYLEIIDKFIENKKIEFGSYELNVINNFLNQLDLDINTIIENIKIVDLRIENKTYRIGFVRTLYKYRNDINKYIKKNNIHNVDTVGMIMSDIDTVSYRNVKDIDASIIASYFGGKGHKNAASNPQNNEKFIKLVKENNL